MKISKELREIIGFDEPVWLDDLDRPEKGEYSKVKELSSPISTYN